MVDVLVAFLECLPEPVIPTALYELALEASNSSQAMAEVRLERGDQLIEDKEDSL